jgi:hypothetical protein
MPSGTDASPATNASSAVATRPSSHSGMPWVSPARQVSHHGVALESGTRANHPHRATGTIHGPRSCAAAGVAMSQTSVAPWTTRKTAAGTEPGVTNEPDSTRHAPSRAT